MLATDNKQTFTYYFFISLLVCYAFFLFFMLPYYILFTTDEVFMANIAQSFIETGHFSPKSCTIPDSIRDNVKDYGFVYFGIVGLFTKYVSNSIIAYRSISYFFMWACLGISYLFIWQEKVSKKLGSWFVVLFVTDQLFTNIVMTGAGRMNSLALFLFLVAIYIFYYEPLKFKNIFANSFCVALFLALALLTTPRIFVLLPLSFIVVYYKYFQLNKTAFADRQMQKTALKNLFFKSITVFSCVSLLYGLWIFYAFGSLLSFYDYYFSHKLFLKGSNESLQKFFTFGNSTPLNFAYIPAIIVLSIITIYAYQQRHKIDFKQSYFFLGMLFTLLMLFFIIRSVYMINLLPFLYLSIILVAKPLYEYNAKNKKFINNLFGLLLLVNVAVFSYKTLKTILFIDLRNEKTVVETLKNAIPPQTPVLASDIYYYAALQSELKYQIFYIGYFYSPQERLKHHLENIKPAYLILSNTLNKEQKENLALYQQHYTLTPYKTIVLTDTTQITVAQKAMKKLANFFNLQPPQSYEGMIYKLQKK
jgi:hypothetical protein